MSQKRAKQIRKAAKIVSAKTGEPEKKLVKIGKKSVRRYNGKQGREIPSKKRINE